MKDFYDLWFMASTMEFEYIVLQSAIENTFTHRKTILAKDSPTALTTQFAEQKQVFWVAFLKKNRIDNAPQELHYATQLLHQFLEPLFNPPQNEPSHWSISTGWK